MSNPISELNLVLQGSAYKKLVKKPVKKPTGVVREDCQYKYCLRCPLNKCEKND